MNSCMTLDFVSHSVVSDMRPCVEYVGLVLMYSTPRSVILEGSEGLAFSCLADHQSQRDFSSLTFLSKRKIFTNIVCVRACAHVCVECLCTCVCCVSTPVCVCV